MVRRIASLVFSRSMGASGFGPGIPLADRERVFDRFYRADASGKIPGTGLGMSIVREIVTLLGGHVSIESTAGVGSMVTIWLPAAL